MEKLSFQMKHWTVYVRPGHTVAVGDKMVRRVGQCDICFFPVQKQWLLNASLQHHNQ